MTNAVAKSKRKPRAAKPEAIEEPAPFRDPRGGKRPNAGRKSAAVEAGSADAHILYAKARAKKEAFQAQLAELEYKTKSGEYLPRADIRQAAATAYATIAQALRSIPDNLERRLGINAELAEEIGVLIDDAMNDLSSELERMHDE